MRSVQKIVLDVAKATQGDGSLLVTLPEGAILLSVGNEVKTDSNIIQERLCMWYLADPQSDKFERRILILFETQRVQDAILNVAELVGATYFNNNRLHVFDLGWKGSGIPTKVWGTDNVIQFPGQQMAAAKADEEGGSTLH